MLQNLLQNIKYRLIRFMQGRNGMDQLARAESWLVIALMLLSLILTALAGSSVWMGRAAFALDIVWMALFVHMYFRVFSRNVSKRRAENQRYCTWRYRRVVQAGRFKKEWAQRKTHRFFRCPTCRQRVRVPRGKGKIRITCPKCREEFTRHS